MHAIAPAIPIFAQQPAKTVLVHYMPWYASKPISGAWGWHWTMNRFDPEIVQTDGKPSIASHDRPLIGPYDSGDDHALECHVLLMKFAGLDGVVIDWYGTTDFRDYAMVHRNTQRLIVQLKKAGLQYSICYEDQSVKHKIANSNLPNGDDVAEGSRDMKWLADHCFNDPAYVTLNGKPVLLVFGPQHFTKEQFDTIRAASRKPPMLFGLPHLSTQTGMDGSFGWPPVAGGREVTRDEWMNYLKELHSKNPAISLAFPAFHDIYNEAGLHDSYGFIDGRNGKTFEETLALALKSPSKIVQIATWNDFGEGTMIEPTAQNGYRYLEATQQALGANNQYSAEDLRLPVLLYELRDRYRQDSQKLQRLQVAADFLFAGKCNEAKALLDKLDEHGK
jgi:hypothetical protein